AHLHIVAAAVAAEGDCSDVRSPGDVLARVAEAARRMDGWVSLHGLEHRRPEGATLELPPPGALEEASGGRPVRIRHRTLHGWYLGPRAAAALRLPAGWVDDPTGDLARAMPRARGEENLERAVAAFSRRLLEAGVTVLQDAGAINGEVEVERLLAWRSRGVLLQEVSVLTAAPCARASGRKLVPSPGASADDLASRFADAAADGALVAVHCADLETLGTVLAAAEPLGRSLRLRIEHATVCPPEWVPRLAALGA